MDNQQQEKAIQITKTVTAICSYWGHGTKSKTNSLETTFKPHYKCKL